MTNDAAGSGGSGSSAGGGNGKKMIGEWVGAIIAAGILGFGASMKFGADNPLIQHIPGGRAGVLGIAAIEILSVVLILVPKTRVYGAALASLTMLGAIASHLIGMVPMDGDFEGMIFMAIVAFFGATTVLLLKKDQLPIGGKA